jgi:hypothetical protein
MNAAYDLAHAHLVAACNAASITLPLADRTGAPTSIPGLEAVAASGRHLVGSMMVNDSGVVVIPNGQPGLLVLDFRLPLSTGVKQMRVDVALTSTEDPRVGLGPVVVVVT